MVEVLDLTGRTAVVTGALGRLGQIWTDVLLTAGAQVVGIDILRDAPSGFQAMLNKHEPQKFALFTANVRSTVSLRGAYDGMRSTLGISAPDVLINNAGIDQPPSAAASGWTFEDIPEDESASILDVNILGTLRTCQVFGSAMARRGSGSIINIGSLYSNVAPDPRLYEHLQCTPPFLKPPAYGASKAGVAALTRYLAALWGQSGVRVNTLSPGGVVGSQDSTFQAKFCERTPMRRMATETDLRGPLLFLASDMSSYVNGIELLVDGGFVCL